MVELMIGLTYIFMLLLPVLLGALVGEKEPDL